MNDRIASRRCEADDLASDYHRGLVEEVEGDCVLKALEGQMYWLCELAGSISTEQVDRIHPPYGWTIRQVFEHCADSERVMGYRALRFAAGDNTELPGFDENVYAASRFGLGNFSNLVSEIGYLRQSNLLLFRRLVPTAWGRQGVADGQPITVRGIAWVIAGHLGHHLAIVEKRCGLSVARTPVESDASDENGRSS